MTIRQWSLTFSPLGGLKDLGRNSKKPPHFGDSLEGLVFDHNRQTPKSTEERVL